MLFKIVEINVGLDARNVIDNDVKNRCVWSRFFQNMFEICPKYIRIFVIGVRNFYTMAHLGENV